MKKLVLVLSFFTLALSLSSCDLLRGSEEKPIGDNAQEEQPQELVEAPEPITIEEQQQEPVATPAPAPTSKGRFIYANAYDGFVNVRAQPSAKSAKLGELKNGPNYLVKLGVEGNWTKVKWQNGVGYVNSSLVGDTPWKPVTLNIDANWIEGQYSFNHCDWFIFSNGRYVCFWNCSPWEYGVWRFEGNEIVLTTKIVTEYEERCQLGCCVGNEKRMEVDEQDSTLGGMFKRTLESKRKLIAEFGENYYEVDHESILVSKEDFLEYKRKAAKLVRLK